MNDKKIKTLDACIIFDVCLILVFTIAMMIIYLKTGNIPDTLVNCFFATAGGELLCTMIITAFKIKYPKNKESEEITDDYDTDF